MDEVFGLKNWNGITYIDMFISQQNKRFGTIFLNQVHVFCTTTSFYYMNLNHGRNGKSHIT